MVANSQNQPRECIKKNKISDSDESLNEDAKLHNNDVSASNSKQSFRNGNISLNHMLQSKDKMLAVRTVEKVQPKRKDNDIEECSLFISFLTFLSFGVILLVGYIKEFFYPPSAKEKNREDYVPLYIGFESFYTRNVFRRIQHCWATPISSVPGHKIELLQRSSPDYGWTLELTGEKINCLNVGSYNYLGFAENVGPCHDQAEKTTKETGIATCSSRLELGTMKIHNELENLMTEFLGVEDVITFGMGFATNVLNIPAMLGPDCLVLSDECNHASIILGIKVSGASVKVFKHNDMEELEKKLRYNIIHGHYRTRRPWKKILIIVEGIYSMEGTICNLPELLRLKKKYKAYLYVDEAHSIGALGPHGAGVVDYFGMDPKEVDIHMGTFTKSFGAAGGYIAGSKKLINHLRINSDAQSYAATMSPPVARQIIASLSIIMGKDGTNEGKRRINQLSRNIRYFRRRLKQIRFIVYGNDDSAVVPLLTYLTPKLVVFVEELKKRGVAGVGVGFPATKLNGARMRFCLSAAHTKEHLDYILNAVSEVGDLIACKHSCKEPSKEVIEW